MRRQPRHRSAWLLAGALLLTAPCARADGGNNPGRKLGRGLANVIFGISEIPTSMMEVGEEHGGGAGTTWGLVRGVGRFIAREATGVFEIVTFLVPIPKNYAAIMDPEFPAVSLRTGKAAREAALIAAEADPRNLVCRETAEDGPAL
jgi:putative exosortase-associated protein (TIGR04073 family)